MIKQCYADTDPRYYRSRTIFIRLETVERWGWGFAYVAVCMAITYLIWSGA